MPVELPSSRFRSHSLARHSLALDMFVGVPSASYVCHVPSNAVERYNRRSDGSLIAGSAYQYRSAGNRTAVFESAGDRMTWTYDAANQLTSQRRSSACPNRNELLVTFHLRSLFFLVTVAGIWVWLNTIPRQVSLGGMSKSRVAVTAEFGYPFTVVECYWGEYLTNVRDPTYRIQIPKNARWSTVQYGSLVLNIAFSAILLSCAAFAFEFMTQLMQKKRDK
jgi:YD repeat-containing protein